jgi:hypothetical protein
MERMQVYLDTVRREVHGDDENNDYKRQQDRSEEGMTAGSARRAALLQRPLTRKRGLVCLEYDLSLLPCCTAWLTCCAAS